MGTRTKWKNTRHWMENGVYLDGDSTRRPFVFSPEKEMGVDPFTGDYEDDYPEGKE